MHPHYHGVRPAAGVKRGLVTASAASDFVTELKRDSSQRTIDSQAVPWRRARHPIDDAADPRLADYRNVSGSGTGRAARRVRRRGAAGRPAAARGQPLRDAVGAGDGRRRSRRSPTSLDARPDAAGLRRAAGGDERHHRASTSTAAAWPSASGRRRRRGRTSLVAPNAQRPSPNVVVVLERVGNADNVGGVFRSAAAFGAGAVLLDPASRRSALSEGDPHVDGRGAAGAVRARASRGPARCTELRARGFAVIAMTPRAGARPLRDVVGRRRRTTGRDRARPRRRRADRRTRSAACEYHARIPMAAGVDSLNVATAAAIALYELSGGPDGRATSRRERSATDR